MRLLDTRTGVFVWVEDPRQVHYAALSHVWATPGDPGYAPEQTYQDLLRMQQVSRPPNTLPSELSDKLRRFCETALKDGFDLAWADTCCIDKTSSSELSEAINSMYSWYAYSGACYAFLHDVDPPAKGSSTEWQKTFQDSKWFKRGWTLQELIASRRVIFVSKRWEVLGSKHGLAAWISSATNVETAVLTFEKTLEDVPIARRMAWMQHRETTRLEDEAYCLMGIFSVTMPTNYGEGRRAFIRLQEKILLQNSDQTIFAWGTFLDESFSMLLPHRSSSRSHARQSTLPDPNHNPTFAAPSFPNQYLLAPSPKDFNGQRSANLVWLSREDFRERLGLPTTEDLYQVFEITPYGLRTHFPLLDICSPDQVQGDAPTHCAILACEDQDKGLLAILLRPRPLSSGHEFVAGAQVVPQHDEHRDNQPASAANPASATFGPAWDHYYRLVYITRQKLRSLRTTRNNASTSSVGPPTMSPRVSIIYILHCPSRSADEQHRDSKIHTKLRETFQRFTVEFCRLSKRMLEEDGYSVSFSSQSKQQGSRSGSRTTHAPSSGSKNTVTISDKVPSDSGVYLTIQVRRCSCDQSQQYGFLSVLVSSRDSDSLDRNYPPGDHEKNHPLHVHSWTFDHGSASRQIDFDSPDPRDPRRFSLRLVLTAIMPRPEKKTVVQRYRLSAELRKREASEVPRPMLPLPLNPSSSQSPGPTPIYPLARHLDRRLDPLVTFGSSDLFGKMASQGTSWLR